MYMTYLDMACWAYDELYIAISKGENAVESLAPERSLTEITSRKSDATRTSTFACQLPSYFKRLIHIAWR